MKEKEFLEIYKTKKLNSEDIQMILSVFSIDEIKRFRENSYHIRDLYNLSFNKKAEDLINQVENENKKISDSERFHVLEYLFERIKRAGQDKIDYFMKADMKRVLEIYKKDQTMKGIYNIMVSEDFDNTLSDKEKELRKIITNFKTINQNNIDFLLSDLVDLNEFKKIHEEIGRARYSVHQMKWKIVYDMVDGKIKNITDDHMDLFFNVCYSSSMSGFKSQKDYLFSLNRDQLFRLTKETNYSRPLLEITQLMKEENYEDKKNNCKTYKEKKEFIEKYHPHYLKSRDEEVVEYILNNEDIHECMKLFGIAENFHEYKINYYDKKWNDLINKKNHTKEEKIEILLGEFPDSFHRLDDEMKEELLTYEIKDFIEFKKFYSGSHILWAFLLKYKNEIDVKEDGSVDLSCGHTIYDIKKIYYDVNFYHDKELKNCCSICNPYQNRSNKEQQLFEMISEIYDGNLKNNAILLSRRRELDIYLSDEKIGFEFNGLFWHSGKRNLEKIKLKIDDSKKLGIKVFVIDENMIFERSDFLQEELEFLIHGKNEKHFNDTELKYRKVGDTFYIEDQSYTENTMNKLKEMILKRNHIVLEHILEYGEGEKYKELGFKEISRVDGDIIQVGENNFYYRIGKIIYEFKN